MRRSETTSILIVGGGPVGLCLASMLAAPGRVQVRVLDAQPEPQWLPDSPDLRVYALSRSSQRVLERAGAWSAVAPYASAYRRMRVWAGSTDSPGPGLHFDAADIGEPDLGHIVEDGLLRCALLESLRSRFAVEVSFGSALEHIDREARSVRVRTTDGQSLSAHLVIAADGAASKARELLHLPVLRRAYGQTAVVAHVRSERPHAETAWQRFLPLGPVALLPLRDGLSSVVWSTSTEQASRLLAEDSDDFAAELTAATDAVLGRLSCASARASFPLQLLHAPRYCLARVALVGDAAHTVHPLAGQGLNLGLSDAEALAGCVIQACRDGQDPGDLRVLRDYELARKGENLKMLAAMDAIHRLFRLSGPLGSSALSVANAVSPLRDLLMRHALGVAGADRLAPVRKRSVETA